MKHPNRIRGISRSGATLLAGAFCSLSLHAQITPSPTPITPPTTESLLGPVAPNSPPPSADPRDLNGVYQPEVFIPAPGALGGGPPAGAPTARPAASRAPAGPGAGGGPRGDANRPTASMLCEPGADLTFGGDVNQIIQLPDRIYFIGETNHLVRRVYLNKDFPAHIALTYAGTSRGHWDGDTLVVETRGLKGTMLADGLGSPGKLRAIARVIERVRKADGGRELEINAVVRGVDADGKPVEVTRNMTNRWRSDLHLMENICEDTAVYFFEDGN